MEIKEFEISIFTTSMPSTRSDIFYKALGLDFANEAEMDYVSYSMDSYYEEVEKIFSKGKKKKRKGWNFKIIVNGTDEQYEKLKLLITGFHIYRQNIIH